MGAGRTIVVVALAGSVLAGCSSGGEVVQGGDSDAVLGLVGTYAPGVTDEDVQPIGAGLTARFENVAAIQDDTRLLIRFGGRTSRSSIEQEADRLRSDPRLCRVDLVPLVPEQDLDPPRVSCP